MGMDDTGVLKHENINANTSFPGPLTGAVTTTGFQVQHDITFTSNRNDRTQVLLTITEDGKLLPGPGLTADVATQQVAGQPVRHFAVAINTAIKEAQKEAADWKRQFEDADKKLGELMLGLTSIHVSPFTDELK